MAAPEECDVLQDKDTCMGNALSKTLFRVGGGLYRMRGLA